MFTLISYQEGISGYYEDDWQIIRRINSPKEFLEALKEGYLEDASNRSQSPINGFTIKYIYLENSDIMYQKHQTYLFNHLFYGLVIIFFLKLYLFWIMFKK